MTGTDLEIIAPERSSAATAGARRRSRRSPNCVAVSSLLDALPFHVHLRNVWAATVSEADDVVLATFEPCLPVISTITVLFGLDTLHYLFEEFAMKVELEDARFSHRELPLIPLRDANPPRAIREGTQQYP